MPLYSKELFILDYEGLIMRRALFNGEDVGITLSNIISQKDVVGMNPISDKIQKFK